MKISQADFDDLSDAIRAIDTSEMRERYLRGDFPRADACKDRDKRYRWDCLYTSGFPVCDRLYPYMDDTHIDTALRRIVAPIA